MKRKSISKYRVFTEPSTYNPIQTKIFDIHDKVFVRPPSPPIKTNIKQETQVHLYRYSCVYIFTVAINSNTYYWTRNREWKCLRKNWRRGETISNAQLVLPYLYGCVTKTNCVRCIHKHKTSEIHTFTQQWNTSDKSIVQRIESFMTLDLHCRAHLYRALLKKPIDGDVRAYMYDNNLVYCEHMIVQQTNECCLDVSGGKLVMCYSDAGTPIHKNEMLHKTPICMKLFFSLWKQILHALEVVHNAGIIHNDINLSNILYDEKSSHISLVDFGSCVIPKKGLSAMSGGHWGLCSLEQLRYKSGCTVAASDVFTATNLMIVMFLRLAKLQGSKIMLNAYDYFTHNAFRDGIERSLTQHNDDVDKVIILFENVISEFELKNSNELFLLLKTIMKRERVTPSPLKSFKDSQFDSDSDSDGYEHNDDKNVHLRKTFDGEYFKVPTNATAGYVLAEIDKVMRKQG